MPHFIVGKYQGLKDRLHTGLVTMFRKNRPGKDYDLGKQARQIARHQDQGQRMVIVNGFEITNRMSSKQMRNL